MHSLKTKISVINELRASLTLRFGGEFINGIQTFLKLGQLFGYLYGTKVDRISDGSV